MCDLLLHVQSLRAAVNGGSVCSVLELLAVALFKDVRYEVCCRGSGVGNAVRCHSLQASPFSSAVGVVQSCVRCLH